MAYGLSNGHVIDDVTWPHGCCEWGSTTAILATAWLPVLVMCYTYEHGVRNHHPRRKNVPSWHSRHANYRDSGVKDSIEHSIILNGLARHWSCGRGTSDCWSAGVA